MFALPHTLDAAAMPLIRALARRTAQHRRADRVETLPRFHSAARRSAVVTHPSSPITPDQSVRTVAEPLLRRGKLALRAAQMLDEARAWAEELTSLECRGPGDLERTWCTLERRTGVPVSAFWSLRYRFDTLKSIDGPIHSLLREAYAHEIEHHIARLQRAKAIVAEISKT